MKPKETGNEYESWFIEELNDRLHKRILYFTKKLQICNILFEYLKNISLTPNYEKSIICFYA